MYILIIVSREGADKDDESRGWQITMSNVLDMISVAFGRGQAMTDIKRDTLGLRH